MMKEIARDLDRPIYGFDWSAGIGQPAGIYWIEGHCLIAGTGSRVEAYLLARGAIPVGILHFGRDPLEGSVPGACVWPVASAELADAIAFGTS